MITGPVVEGFLFALFAGLTAALQAVLAPTYDNLLVPALAPSALYPSADPAGGFLAPAGAFSAYVVAHVVDPLVPVLALALGAIYLARAVVPSLARRTEALLPKFVAAVVLANLTGPVAAAILGLASAGYPVLAGFDGGAWQQWVDLAGPGAVSYSWDNGALAFVLSLVLFALVLLLVVAVAVRNALLGVLLVALPILTLTYPIPTLGALARRGWLLFGELAFLPWILVIPLELAVGCPSAPLLVGYLTVALAAPGILAVSGGSLTALGLPSAGNAVSYGLQRNLSLGSSAGGSLLTPAGGRSVPTAGAAVQGAARAATAVPLPATLPIFAGELAGHAAAHLFQHLPSGATGGSAPAGLGRFPAVHPPAGAMRP